MTYVLVLWLSFVPGKFISVEVPMPDEEACRRALAAHVVKPRPNERVASCKPAR
jgi:hypothetical protein